ncbi:MAG: hypothetical protein QXQ41_00480, partial [Candidatus Bathyarchaeia archaeon]
IMPDMKIVISDPEAEKSRWIKVVFIADPALPYGEDEKSGRKLSRFMKALRRLDGFWGCF